MLRVTLFSIVMGLIGASCGPAPVSGNNVRELTTVKSVRNAFPEATEVRLFVETATNADGDPVLSKPAGLKLSPKQRAEFESSLTVQPQPQESAACFIPHHGIRLESGGKTVDLVICFKCAQVKSYVDITPTDGMLISTSPRPTFNRILEAAGVPLSAQARE